MTEMTSSGKFVPKEHEVDYDLEPCYKHYGLKHGQLSCYSDDLENETFRTAIQVRIDTVDFVRKYGDQLKIRMSGLEFLSLVNQWAKIQEHSKKHKGKFAPYYISDDGKFSIEHKTIGTNSHNIMYMTANMQNVTVEESQEDMVSRYFQTPQGKMNINKYGKAKAAKKAKNLTNIM